MKSTNERAKDIFLLLARIREGDAQALQEAEQIADKFFLLNNENNLCLLVFAHPEVPKVQKCYTFRGGLSTSFFIPESFELKDVKLEGEIYSFFSKNGTVISAILSQLDSTWNQLPFAGHKEELRVTHGHVERVFLNIGKNNPSEYQDEYLGFIEYQSWGCYMISEYKEGVYNPNIYVQTNDLGKLKSCLPPLKKILSIIENLDKKARKELKKDFNPTEEELAAVSINGIEFYEEGEFDFFYNLPEEEVMEYVRVCFSKESIPIETTFGNY